MSFKTYLMNSQIWGGILWITNALNLHNHYKMSRGNSIVSKGARIQGISVSIKGINNKITIGNNSILRKCEINIFGNNNIIEIGEKCRINGGKFWIEDDGGTIQIGKFTTVQGNTQFAAIEGTTIYIGQDCMFSSDISLRTGDSHSILNRVGERINPSADIHIGDHVWIGADVAILKGVSLPSNSIVGMRSLVNKSFASNNIIIAGSPAKIVKNEVNWDRMRL